MKGTSPSRASRGERQVATSATMGLNANWGQVLPFASCPSDLGRGRQEARPDPDADCGGRLPKQPKAAKGKTPVAQSLPEESNQQILVLRGLQSRWRSLVFIPTRDHTLDFTEIKPGPRRGFNVNLVSTYEVRPKPNESKSFHFQHVTSFDPKEAVLLKVHVKLKLGARLQDVLGAQARCLGTDQGLAFSTF